MSEQYKGDKQEKNKMKFKVGDKVRILPSATDMGVDMECIGKTAVVTDTPLMRKYIGIRMDDVSPIVGYCRGWAIKPTDIAPVIRVGQQLLLWGE